MERRRWTGALAALGIGVALAGCAAGGSTSTGSGGSSAPVGLGTVSSGATTGGSTTAGSASESSAGPRAGLAASRGYGTYELCQGHCTGEVPATLRRPLRLPRADGGPCPVTVHPDGPVVPSTSTQVGFSAITGSPWLGAEVTWSAGAAYPGPILIRGGEVGGGPLGFGEGRTPYDALQLRDAGRVSPRVPGGGRAWTTYTRVRGPGCFAYQVDGTTFTETIVFRAIG